MRLTSFLCVAGIALWSATGATQPAELPSTLRTHLKEDRFQVVTSIRGLPLGVRDALQTLFKTSVLDIADPDGAFRANGADSALPSRRLVAATCSMDHCIVYYQRAGAAPSWRVAAFHWTPTATRLEWGGMAPGGLNTIDDVRKAILSGAIKSSVDAW